MGSRGLGIGSRGTPPLAAVLAAFIVGLGVTSSLATRDLSRERSDRAATETFASAEAAFLSRLAETLSDFEDSARSPVAGGSPAGLTFLERRGERLIVRPDGTLLPPGRDLSDQPVLADAAAEARDSGTTHVAVTYLAGGPDPRAVAVIPLFGTRTPPAGTAERRVRLTGVAVGDLGVAGLAEAAFHDIRGAVLIAEGDDVLYSRGDPGGARSRVDVEIRNRTWGIAYISLPVSAGPLPWLFTVLALVLAATVVTVAAQRAERIRLADARAAALIEENAMITEIGALLQQTPDISETLPSVAVRVADAFGLDAIRVSAAAADGAQTDLFVYGRFDAGARARDVSFPLVRAGRGIGTMTVRVRGDEAPGTGLHTIAGLLSAAMANARAFEAERATVERLRGIDQLKTEFLATISHEIRTPLVSITGFAQLLTSTWDELEPSVIKDYVGRIDRNASALSRLLQQVLDFSRLERGRFRVSLSDLDLTATLRELLERDAPMLEHHHLDITAPETLPVRSDPAALEQIVNNLVSNAVKFSPVGSRIGLALGLEGEDVVLSVEDDGPGVPPEERDRVFQRFYRGSTDAALRTRGAGIGLAIVAELVGSLRGSVQIEDAPSGGARFIVRLPRTMITTEARGAA